MDLDEILAPLRAAWDRMRRGQPAAYCGFEPTVGAAVRGGTLAEALSPEGRARAAARGEDVVDGFLAAAYFLGLEQGMRYQNLAVQALALGALAELERHERARGSSGEAIECLYRCLGVDRAEAAAWPVAPPAPPPRDARSLRTRVAERLERERGDEVATPSSLAAFATVRAELAVVDRLCAFAGPDTKGAPVSYVTREGVLRLPNNVRAFLQLEGGGGVVFDREEETGYVRILTNQQLLDLLEPSASKAGPLTTVPRAPRPEAVLEYGKPTIMVPTPPGTSDREIRAALHRLAATIWQGMPEDENWSVVVDDSALSTGFGRVRILLLSGSEQETQRALDVLWTAIAAVASADAKGVRATEDASKLRKQVASELRWLLDVTQDATRTARRVLTTELAGLLGAAKAAASALREAREGPRGPDVADLLCRLDNSIECAELLLRAMAPSKEGS